MAKRGADEGVGGEPPPKKVQFEQIKIGPVSTLEEIDMKTLHFQNKKLAEVRLNLLLFSFEYATL